MKISVPVVLQKKRPKKTRRPKKGRSKYTYFTFFLLLFFSISYEIDMELNPEGIEDNGYIGLICTE